MNPSASPKTEQRRDEILLSKIKKAGWAVIAIPADEDSPPFAYTIGLYEQFAHPEIILFGIDAQESTKALNFMAERVQSGEKFTFTTYLDVLTEPCLFAPVDVDKDKWLGYARWYYQTDFPAIQCFWADPKGGWPWNKDCDPRVAQRQVILNAVSKQHHYLETEYYPTGEAATKIVRRYLTLSKFKHLLDDSSIYFRNAALFMDKFEGSTPKKLFKYFQASFNEFASQSEQNVAVAAEVDKRRISMLRARLNASYVSCWITRSHESSGMWTNYARCKYAPGVAVESNYKTLLRSFIGEKPSEHALVQYANFDTDAFENGKLRHDFGEQPLNFKRIEYEDEHELRLIVFREDEATSQVAANDFKPKQEGINLKVSLETLLQKVIVGPGATDSFLSDIQNLLKDKGLNVPVVKSALDGKPLH